MVDNERIGGGRRPLRGYQMRKIDVPQDAGPFNGLRGLSYAVDGNGKYVQAATRGWTPCNLANELARDRLDEQLVELLAEIRAGKLSPLAYHMARSKMDAWLLAKYAGLSQKKIKRHLAADGFATIGADEMARYADLFDITVEELCNVPEQVSGCP